MAQGIKAFRYGIDKMPAWMSYYIEKGRFAIYSDGSYCWAELKSSGKRAVVNEGDWIVERHYKLTIMSNQNFNEEYELI